MPTGGKGSGSSGNPFLTKKKKHPSQADKMATVYAAEAELKPWELPQGKGKSVKAKPEPLDTRYKAAVAAPVNAPVKVGKKKEPAREYLAKTVTPERRQQYERAAAIPAPKPDS